MFLERSHRAIQTWLVDGAKSLQYDYGKIMRDLMLPEGSMLTAFWFDNYTHAPWVALDGCDIAMAATRMHDKDEPICFFIASDIRHVASLSAAERGAAGITFMPNGSDLTLTASFAEIWRQRYPIATLSFRREQAESMHCDDARLVSTQCERRPSDIPGIEDSLRLLLEGWE